MSNAILDGSGARGFTASDGADYGCAGRGTFNPFAKTEGRHVDTADRAFYIWKKCVQCATGNDSENIEPYDYDQVNDSCGKSKVFDPHCYQLASRTRTKNSLASKCRLQVAN